ncbi:PREDICTED: neurotrimin-like [Acropora digitifera]|uniref:neurotrimin-like n=1 Tax=Acropora digitifera TaxID=70779 RepID=UPI00077ABBB3|nr:PREDICTED: neurotrimin-like [Acropora digitifera]
MDTCYLYLIAFTSVFPGELELKFSSGYAEISENKGSDLSCEFTGRPRPQIVWEHNNTIAIKAVITERETQHKDILITTSTLSIPGRSEFRGFYTCSATSRLDSGWSSTKQDIIEVEFSCLTGPWHVEAKGSRHVETNAFENISISCFVHEQAALGCTGFAWHFKNKSLKTNGKYRISKLEDTEDYCKKVLKLEIINATENDEGDYRCQQSKCLPETWGSSDIIEINVRPPPGE